VRIDRRGNLLACLVDGLPGRRPYSCRLDALPYWLSSQGSMAASTAGSSGVVALWSR
jgi:hypothetical protein